MSTFENIKEGSRDGIPICLGYLAVSFAFGIQATRSGLTIFQAVLMSLTNVTSAGQFSSLDMIASHATYFEVAMVQLVINMRYLLMSCSLSQKLSPKISLTKRLGISYGVTDEIFGVSVLRKGELKPSYSMGLIIISVFGWVLGTFLGGISGEIMPQKLISALGMAIYGMFIAIIIPESKESKPVLLVVLSAMLLSVLFTYMPVLKLVSSGFRIIIITVVISALAAFLFPIPVSDDEKDKANTKNS
ncbi:Predicted branched-chain amino acid permease (azaleucine resistance) [Acetitomaculum ruminis DSM 5522]|uniref:Predicted branched-chain amino acid permease (Azaleucine resistance) n=1 Tax=Acetitomaculum ruminis DSM 5522 TaxID=1120918 RepID=A0A1I0XB60_9FIRM|nr:AzlC family ABC transporter permease [Acetitomaculum ruminis]SFA97656.1 Predicted branched-chain amino acid permease (azaleucine resistance) [Acetitomaculum ruminis DSM 5522]